MYVYLDLLFVFAGFFVLKLFNEQVVKLFCEYTGIFDKINLYLFLGLVVKILKILDFRHA